MARVYEESVVLKISKLVKENSEDPELATNEFLTTLEAVAQEMLGTTVMVETIRN
jgi:hypothetical protein